TASASGSSPTAASPTPMSSVPRRRPRLRTPAGGGARAGLGGRDGGGDARRDEAGEQHREARVLVAELERPLGREREQRAIGRADRGRRAATVGREQADLPEDRPPLEPRPRLRELDRPALDEEEPPRLLPAHEERLSGRVRLRPQVRRERTHRLL